MPTARFFSEVYDVVSQIPFGKVTTYGMVARLVGFPNHSRLVARALANTPAGRDLPCWRVVNAQGRTAPNWPDQQRLLEAEGVRFRRPGCADLGSNGWNPFEQHLAVPVAKNSIGECLRDKK